MAGKRSAPRAGLVPGTFAHAAANAPDQPPPVVYDDDTRGVHALGNPWDRVYRRGEHPPARRAAEDPDGSDPGFVGRRPGDDTHTPPVGMTAKEI